MNLYECCVAEPQKYILYVQCEKRREVTRETTTKKKKIYNTKKNQIKKKNEIK